MMGVLRVSLLLLLLSCVCHQAAALTKCKEAMTCEECAGQSEQTRFLKSSRSCLWLQDNSQALPEGKCVREDKIKSAAKTLHGARYMQISEPARCPSNVCEKLGDCKRCIVAGCLWVEWNKPTAASHLPRCTTRTSYSSSLQEEQNPESRSTADLYIQQSNLDAEWMCKKSTLQQQLDFFYHHVLKSADFKQLLKVPHLDEDGFASALEEFIGMEKELLKDKDEQAIRFYNELSVLFDPETAPVYDDMILFEYLRKSIPSGTVFDRLESSQLQPSAEPFYAHVMLVTGEWKQRMLSAVANVDWQRAQRLTALAHLAISLGRLDRKDIRDAVSRPLMSALLSRYSELSRLMIPLLKDNMEFVQENVRPIGSDQKFDRTVLSSALEINRVEILEPDFNIVKLLLDNGARPDQITIHDNCPLEFAYRAREYFPTVADRVIEEFFRREPKTLCKANFFRYFVEYSDISRLQLCIGLHPELLGTTKDRKDSTELINYATERDFTAGVVWLLEEAKRLQRTVKWRKSAVLFPIRNLNRVLVDLLLEEGMDAFDPSQRDYPLLVALKRFVIAEPHQVETALEIVSLLSRGVDLAAVHPLTQESPLDCFFKELMDRRSGVNALDEKLKYYFTHANDECRYFHALLEPFHADPSPIRNTLTAFAHLEQIARLNTRRRMAPVVAFKEAMEKQQLTIPDHMESAGIRHNRLKMAEALWSLTSRVNRVLFEAGGDLDQELIAFVTAVASVADLAYIRSILFSISSEYGSSSARDPAKLFTMDSLKQLQAELVSPEPTSEPPLKSIHDFFWADLNRKYNGPTGFQQFDAIEEFGSRLMAYASVCAVPQLVAVDLMNRLNEELNRLVPGASPVMTAIADASGLKHYNLAISPKAVTGPLSKGIDFTVAQKGKEHSSASSQSAAFVDPNNNNAPVLPKVMNEHSLTVDPAAEKAYTKYLEGLQHFMIVGELVHPELTSQVTSRPTPAALDPGIKSRYFKLSATVFKSDRQFYVKLLQIKLLQTSIKFNSLYGVSPSAVVEERELKQQLEQLPPDHLAFVASVDIFCDLSKTKSKRCDPIKEEEKRMLSYLKQLGGSCQTEGGPALIQALSRTMAVVLIERFLSNGVEVGAADPTLKMAALGGYLRHLATKALVLEQKEKEKKSQTQAPAPDDRTPGPQKPKKQVDERTAQKNARKNERKRQQELEKMKEKKIDCSIAKSMLSQFIPAWLLSVRDESFSFESQSRTDSSAWFDVAALSASMINGFITQFEVDSTNKASESMSTLDWVGNQLATTILDDSKWQKPELLFTYLTQRTKQVGSTPHTATAKVFKRWVRAVVGVSSETPFDIRYKDDMNLEGFKPFETQVINTWIDPNNRIPSMTDDPLSMFLLGEYSDGSCQRVSADISDVNIGVMGYVVNANTKLITLDQDPRSKIFSGRAVIRLGHLKSVKSGQDEPLLILEAPYKGIYKGRTTPPEQLERSILIEAKRIQAAFLAQNIHISMVFRISHYSEVVSNQKQMCNPSSSIPDDSVIELTAGVAPYIYSDFAMLKADGPSFLVSMAEKELFCIVDRHTHAHLPDLI